MTYRMGLLMPDRFAAADPYVGPARVPALGAAAAAAAGRATTTSRARPTTSSRTALNLPFEINNGGVDELVPAAGAQQQAQTFRDAGNPHLFYFYPVVRPLRPDPRRTSGATRATSSTSTRRATCRRTRCATSATRRWTCPSTGCGFDGAYWVDGMAVRTPGDSCSPGQSACESASGQVEAYTLGHGRARSTTQAVTTAYPGPPFPATVQGTTRVPGGPIPAQNRFEATFTNLRAAAFETGRMGLDPGSRADRDS